MYWSAMHTIEVINLVIKALDKEFEVIHVIDKSSGYRILQCCDTKERQIYTVLHFKENEMIKKLLPLFYLLGDNGLCEDYQGCFSSEEGLFCVFCKRKGIPLNVWLEEEPDLDKRVQIGKKLLEKLILWKIPDFMICQLIDKRKILIREEDIEFDYDWSFELIEPYNMTLINQRMKALLEYLFHHEISHSVSPALMRLIKDLEKDVPEDFFAIYEAYNSLYDDMAEDVDRYLSRFERAKVKVQSFIQKVIEIGKLMLCVAAYVAAVYLFLSEIKEQEKRREDIEKVRYEKIGTLEIRQEG